MTGLVPGQEARPARQERRRRRKGGPDGRSGLLFPRGTDDQGSRKRGRASGFVRIVLPDTRFGNYGKILYNREEMKRNRNLTLTLSAIATLSLGFYLSACSYISAFRKEAAPKASYDVSQIGDTTYRIDLQGLESTSRNGVTTHLLEKAASVTLKKGCDYFLVSGGEVRGENEMQATPFAGSTPESPSGSLAEGTARLSQRYSGSILFHIFKGEMPPGNPLAFDARALAR